MVLTMLVLTGMSYGTDVVTTPVSGDVPAVVAPVVAPAITPISTTTPAMPDINLNYTLLYSLDTKKIINAPSAGVTILSALNKVITGDFEVSWLAKDNTNNTFIGGPALGIDWFRLISEQTAITVEKNFKLKSTLGGKVDMFHINGINLSDLKKLCYISAGFGFTF